MGDPARHLQIPPSQCLERLLACTPSPVGRQLSGRGHASLLHLWAAATLQLAGGMDAGAGGAYSSRQAQSTSGPGEGALSSPEPSPPLSLDTIVAPKPPLASEALAKTMRPGLASAAVQECLTTSKRETLQGRAELSGAGLVLGGCVLRF